MLELDVVTDQPVEAVVSPEPQTPVSYYSESHGEDGDGCLGRCDDYCTSFVDRMTNPLCCCSSEQSCANGLVGNVSRYWGVVTDYLDSFFCWGH